MTFEILGKHYLIVNRTDVVLLFSFFVMGSSSFPKAEARQQWTRAVLRLVG